MNEYKMLFNIVKLSIKTKSGKSSIGTSFFYKVERKGIERNLLITNKHVLEDAIEITFFLHTSFEKPGSIRKLTMSGENLMSVSTFHPYNQDLCAIDVTNYIKSEDKFYSLNSDYLLIEEDQELKKIVENVYIIGYPEGLEDVINKLPVITVGTTASSLSINYNGDSLIMLNAFSMPGSSGSPVFVERDGRKLLIGLIVGLSLDNLERPIYNLSYAIKSNSIVELEKQVVGD